MNDRKGRLVFVAPTERGDHVRHLETVFQVERSLVSETKGCDILWSAQGQWYGVQRKEIKDLYASLDDGRLTKELAQMAQLGTVPWLVVEGKLQVTVTDPSITVGRRVVPYGTHVRTLDTIADRGVKIVTTPTAAATGAAVAALVNATWSTKRTTGTARPKAKGAWGTATNKEWAMHLLQGFDGIGPDMARAIVDKFGGIPMAWSVTLAELMEVEGVGKVRAAKLINALRG